MIYPSLPILNGLILGLILVALPHIIHVVGWIYPTFFTLLGWRYCMTRYQWSIPNNFTQLSIAAFILLGTLFSYHTIFGIEAGIAFLIALTGLKLLEMNTLRDALLICFLSYFLIMTNFLYSQSIPMALYMLAAFGVITTVIITLNDLCTGLSLHQRLRFSVTLLLQTLPLMLTLFILFPRIPGAFLGLPDHTSRSKMSPKEFSGSTGLDDQMAPGFGEMNLSDEIAFRVQFKGNHIPPSNQLYWRGIVLWWSNGREWKTRFTQENISQPVSLHPKGQAVDYTLTLEPHDHHWLLALDLPLQAPLQGMMTLDYQLISHFPIQQRVRYPLRSYTHYYAKMITPRLRTLALSLPQGKHPRAVALAQQWRKEDSSPTHLIQRALQYFNQHFFYTYTPPLAKTDSIDEFLFETHQGYCEHYAAAFTVLMRAAGIPTRIVTGYLGGTVNPIGNYLIVRQYDAHAWSEVWLEDKGWVRIDPTGTVAPDRIERDLRLALFPDSESLLGLDKNSSFAQFKQNIKNSWDAMNNSWNQWVVGYDTLRQEYFLGRFGLKIVDWEKIALFLVMILGTFLALIAAWIFLRSPGRVHDPVQKIYLRFCKKLNHYGLQRRANEGPLDFANRVSTTYPQLREQVHAITQLYLNIRYANQSDVLIHFKKAVDKFPK